ncbi:MAG: ABC transporter permease subunit [Chloroflexi bacterium]|nr:ABC transporter permease subunit [Chloroflexota bacterium]
MGALLKKELREQWRTYRFLVVTAVLMLFGLLSPLLARYTPELLKSMPGLPPELGEIIPAATVGDAVGQYLKNTVQFGVILALLIPMSAVAGEKERGTAAMLLSKPVSRETFLLAKFAALGLTFLAGMALGGLGGYYYTGILFEWLPPDRFAALSGLLLLYLLVYLALTLFASALARTQAAAAGIAFGLYLLMGLAGVIPQLARILPGKLVAWGGQIALGQAAEPPWAALWVSVGLILAALAGAGIALRRQEL